MGRLRVILFILIRRRVILFILIVFIYFFIFACYRFSTVLVCFGCFSVF